MKRVVLALAVAAALLGLAVAGRWAAPFLAPSATPSWLARAAYPLEHTTAIRAAARRNHLDPALVAAVIYAESRFDEHARSARGAIGLMQVLPVTAEQIARETGGATFVPADLEDPAVNVRYGCYYLRRALEAVDGDTLAAVASYNAGMGAVGRWEKAADGRLRLDDIRYAETRAYVERVLALRRLYRDAYGARLQTPDAPG